jgi:hypothetical protein
VVAAVLDLGDVVSLDFTTQVNGSRVNATTAVLTITLPDGTSATPTVLNPEPGVYSASYPTTQVGRHTLRWLATGPAGRAHTDVFNVREPVSLALLSLAEAREHLNMPPGDTIDDEELRRYIDATTTIIERHVNKIIARRTITEWHQFDSYRWVNSWETGEHGLRPSPVVLTLNAVPVVSVTSVATIDGLLTWDVAALDIDGPLGLVTDRSGRGFRGDLKAVFVAGYASIPPNYELAAAIVVDHLWRTQRTETLRPSGLGVSEDRFGYLGSVGYAIPPRAVELLGGRPPVFA